MKGLLIDVHNAKIQEVEVSDKEQLSDRAYILDI